MKFVLKDKRDDFRRFEKREKRKRKRERERA
jgi:hypothetical protein